MNSRRGQSTLELAVTIVAVAAAAIFMAIFLKRSVMGKMRDSGAQMGEQFSPLVTHNSYNNTYNVKRQEITNNDGTASSTITSPETRTRTGNETVDQALDQEKLFN